MRIVEANPAKPRRLICIFGCAWAFALLIDYCMPFDISGLLILVCFFVSIALTFQIAWHVPAHRVGCQLGIHFMMTAAFFLPLLAHGIYWEFYDFTHTREQYPTYSIMLCFTIGLWFVYYLLTLICLSIAYWILGRIRTFRKIPACQICGYNLTGNISGTCPECGTAIPVMVQSGSDDLKEVSQPGEVTSAGDSDCAP